MAGACGMWGLAAAVRRECQPRASAAVFRAGAAASGVGGIGSGAAVANGNSGVTWGAGAAAASSAAAGGKHVLWRRGIGSGGCLGTHRAVGTSTYRLPRQRRAFCPLVC